MLQKHCVKLVRIWHFSSPYFLLLRLNTDIYFVDLRIYECGKLQTRNTSNTDTSYLVEALGFYVFTHHFASFKATFLIAEEFWEELVKGLSAIFASNIKRV